MLPPARIKELNREEIAPIAERLGDRIRVARLQRRWRQVDLCERAGVSRETLHAIERGTLNVGLGAVLQVLWSMGLTNEIELVADPGLDRQGLAISIDSLTKRVYVPRKVDDNF